MYTIEEAKIRLLLSVGHLLIPDIHADMAVHHTVQSRAFLRTLDIDDRAKHYISHNAKLYGYAEASTKHVLVAEVLVRKFLREFQVAGGDMMLLNGRNLILALITEFSRDTSMHKKDAMNLFHARTLENTNSRDATTFIAILEKDVMELLRMEKITEVDLAEELMSTFIDAIHEDSRYTSLSENIRMTIDNQDVI